MGETRDTHHHARVSCPQAMSRRVELAVIAPTAAAEPEALVQANDPLTAVAEKAQLKYNEAIDCLCKRVEEGAKEEGELAPIIPYDPDSDAPNQCLVVDEEQRPMPLYLCPTVLSELDLPRASMGIARVLVASSVCTPPPPTMTHHPTPQAKLAYACPFAKPPLYECMPLTTKEARLRQTHATL